MNDDSATPPVPAKPPRLDSLDALRGFDLFALTFSFFYFYYFQLKKNFPRVFQKSLADVVLTLQNSAQDLGGVLR